MDIHARLPRRFVEDREARGLPTGLDRYVRNQAVIFASQEVIDDMAHDADYQARHTDSDDRALRRSAARAYDILAPKMSAEMRARIEKEHK